MPLLFGVGLVAVVFSVVAAALLAGFSAAVFSAAFFFVLDTALLASAAVFSAAAGLLCWAVGKLCAVYCWLGSSGMISILAVWLLVDAVALTDF